MGKTITAVYKMLVYSDGGVELKLMPLEYIFEPLSIDHVEIIPSRISQRTYQIIRVLQEIHCSLAGTALYDGNLSVMKQIVTNATRKVAAELQITEQSVSDKFTRQLGGITKKDFVVFVADFFKFGYDKDTFYNSDLYKAIIDTMSSDNDEIAYVKTNFINSIL